MADPALPIADHLRELRRRAGISLLAILVCSAGLLPLAPTLFDLLAQPMREQLPAGMSFIALTPFEAWSVYFRLSLGGGLILSAPVWIGQLLCFARPALGAPVGRRIFFAGILALLFFLSGAAFCYAAVLPAAFSWGIALIEAGDIRMLPQMSAYASFTITLLFAFGLAFELPIFIALLMRLGIVTAEALARTRPYAIVAAFIAGAILTPPDVVSQTLLSIPLILLYEAGILLGRILRAPTTRTIEDEAGNGK